MDAIEKEVERVAAKVPSLYPFASSSSSSSSPSSSTTSIPATSAKRSASGSSKLKPSSSSASLTTVSVSESLDSLLTSLETIQASLQSASASSSSSTPVIVAEVKSSLNRTQKTIAERQKEVYNALSRLGKAYDKKFTMSVDGIADPGLFMGPEPQRALEAVVLDHMLRMKEWDAADQLSQDSGVPLPPSSVYVQLDSILSSLGAGDVQPAIDWALSNRNFLQSRNSPLEYALHRSHFIRIATGQVSSRRPQASQSLSSAQKGSASTLHVNEASPFAAVNLSPLTDALMYGRTHFRPHLRNHLAEVQALFTFLLFLAPVSPPVADTKIEGMVPSRNLYWQVPQQYHHFLDDNLVHTPYLVPLFQSEFCTANKLAKEAPLRIAVEVGIGGALMKIMKVRKVMQLSGNEWSQADELPIDIPLPSSLHFHSTFTCPVSKEQATEDNPPMMMACGHVLCAESLTRLGKSHGRVKCPYCPMESTISQATRLYF